MARFLAQYFICVHDLCKNMVLLPFSILQLSVLVLYCLCKDFRTLLPHLSFRPLWETEKHEFFKVSILCGSSCVMHGTYLFLLSPLLVIHVFLIDSYVIMNLERTWCCWYMYLYYYRFHSFKRSRTHLLTLTPFVETLNLNCLFISIWTKFSHSDERLVLLHVTCTALSALGK